MCFLATLFSLANGQKINEINRWMTDTGFENVQAFSSSDTLFISYENRIHRYEVAALQEIISYFTALGSYQTLILFPKHQGIPIVQLIINTADGKLQTTPSFNTHLWKQSGFSSTASQNKTYWKADISVGPWIYGTQIGNYDDAIKIELDLAPTLQIQLTKGLKLTGQWLIPVFNNYSDDGLRPGIVTLAQSVRLPWNIFATASIGQYNPRRYGARLNGMLYTNDGQFGMGGTLGYTLLSSSSGEALSPFYEDRATHIGRIDLSYRLLEQDLTINASVGTFLYQDLGIKVEARRQFEEAQIAVFAQVTSLVENAGFSLLLPIPVKRYRPIKRVRVRTQRHINYQYRFRGQTFGGLEMQDFSNLSTKVTELHPAFLYNKNQNIDK